MRNQYKCVRQTVVRVAVFSLLLPLAACANIDLWPFGSDQTQQRRREPANATAYQCATDKRFYVRLLDGGSAAWLILPDREVRLDKIVAGGNGSGNTRYSNGIAVLELQGNSASLTDGPTINYSGCTKVTN